MKNIFTKTEMNSKQKNDFTSLVTNQINEIYKLVAEQVINNKKIKCKKTLVYNLDTKKISSRKSFNRNCNYLIFEFNVNEHFKLTIDATISLSNQNGLQWERERVSLEKFGIKTNHEAVIMSPISGCHNGPWLAGYGLLFLRRHDEPLDD